MQSDIHLIGVSQTTFGEHWDKSLRDLMEEAIGKAIASSPCTALDIDTVVIANMIGERTSNQAHLGALASSLLPHRPPALRVEAACASGSVALHTACALLESRRAETVLVLGVEKMTDAPLDEVHGALMGAGDSELDAPAGLTFAGIFGLITQRYMHDYGLTRDQLSLVSVVHHLLAQENIHAQFRNSLTPEQVSRSAPVASPLRLLDCSPISDGAAAVLLSTKHESSLRMAASSISNDVLSLTERYSLTSFPATREAVEGALREADITRQDIRCMEVHDCFSIAALINLEDLGFAEEGEGIAYYSEALRNHSRAGSDQRSAMNDKQSALMVNSSGGLKACGHPVGATGVKQLVDTAKYLRASNVRWGMTHNLGGIGATAGVHILENTAA